jgi:hypothetical protein
MLSNVIHLNHYNEKCLNTSNIAHLKNYANLKRLSSLFVILGLFSPNFLYYSLLAVASLD